MSRTRNPIKLLERSILSGRHSLGVRSLRTLNNHRCTVNDKLGSSRVYGAKKSELETEMKLKEILFEGSLGTWVQRITNFLQNYYAKPIVTLAYHKDFPAWTLNYLEIRNGDTPLASIQLNIDSYNVYIRDFITFRGF